MAELEYRRDSTIKAPFTVEQVEALNRYQQGGWFHPFTCGNCSDRLGTDTDERLLVGAADGWICPTCDYTQDWAHKLMLQEPPAWWDSEHAAAGDSDRRPAT